ncbi:hypothetical protein [Empedobacter sedimenti]|uniref:hypothetical protein n=1 Tax=Empedobacter TaxID=59734 RepID=UPI0024A64832|nr:hypothetical protein [Empedobacter sedimenti]
MSSIIKNARSNKIWYQLHKATGFSSSYCKKVVTGDREKKSKGAKMILKKFNEIAEILEPCNN